MKPAVCPNTDSLQRCEPLSPITRYPHFGTILQCRAPMKTTMFVEQQLYRKVIALASHTCCTACTVLPAKRLNGGIYKYHGGSGVLHVAHAPWPRSLPAGVGVRFLFLLSFLCVCLCFYSSGSGTQTQKTLAKSLRSRRPRLSVLIGSKTRAFCR